MFPSHDLARFMIKHWRGVLSVAGVLLLIGLYYYVRGLGYDQCELKYEIKRLKAIEETLNVKEKQNSVVRPDDVELINCLRSGTF